MGFGTGPLPGTEDLNVRPAALAAGLRTGVKQLQDTAGGARGLCVRLDDEGRSAPDRHKTTIQVRHAPDPSRVLATRQQRVDHRHASNSDKDSLSRSEAEPAAGPWETL